jgi:tRNA-2-methylthio-N6-dimethylallyladenosine synthase
MPSYHVWTVGCQMNVADSERLASALDQLGYQRVPQAEQADVVVLNSCVVRQGAEDKVVARLDSLRGYKRKNPDVTIALMGCMVGPRIESLQERFPHVDFFLRPQEFQGLVDFAAERQGLSCDTDLALLVPSRPQVSTFVPIIHGCDEFCTYCIVPYRRGRERSRPIPELVHEAEMLVQRGVVEITLLGQIVDRYGHDLPDSPGLADLLAAINAVEGLQRIRFLTSHPRDMGQRILDAVASLPKVCEHLNIPFQAGDNDVLKRMRRPYTIEQYLELVERARATIPGVSLSTDVIVGFCSETEEEFQRTVDVLEQVRFDVVHVAAYSTRPGTIASRKLVDDVPVKEKLRRKGIVETLQERIAAEVNAQLLGTKQEVLVERKAKGRWEGRTRTNKIVHFDDSSQDWTGRLTEVEIVRTSPWSLIGILPGHVYREPEPDSSANLVIDLQAVR